MKFPDRSGTRVVLIGASSYGDELLPDLPVVRASINDLAATLTDPELGIVDEENCHVLLDQPSVSSIGRVLTQNAREATGLLLVCFIGHGLIGGRRSELYLATPSSSLDHPEWDSLKYEMLRDAVLDSLAETKAIILDCCFSGRAFGDAMGDVIGVALGQVDVDGSYVLTSAPRNKASLVLPGEIHTAFTGRLIRFLRSGLPNGEPLITLGEAYRSIRRLMRAEGLVEPQQRSTGTAERLAIGRNVLFLRAEAERRAEEARWAAIETGLRAEDARKPEVERRAKMVEPMARKADADRKTKAQSGRSAEKARLTDVAAEARRQSEPEQKAADRKVSAQAGPGHLVQPPRITDPTTVGDVLSPAGAEGRDQVGSVVGLTIDRSVRGDSGTPGVEPARVKEFRLPWPAGRFAKRQTQRSVKSQLIGGAVSSIGSSFVFVFVIVGPHFYDQWQQGRVKYYASESEKLTQSTAWRIEVVGRNCAIDLFESTGKKVGAYVRVDDRAVTKGSLQSRPGDFVYKVTADSGDCDVTPLGNPGEASLPLQMGPGLYDSEGLPTDQNIRVTVNPVNDPDQVCRVALRNSRTGKDVVTKKAVSGKPFTFDFTSGQDVEYLRQLTPHCKLLARIR